MTKKLMITGILLLILSFSAFATETRVHTMGDNNMILLDEANITLFPSRINDYPNIVVGEFGRVATVTEGGIAGFGDGFNDPASTPEFQSFGMHWKFGDENPWVLGTYFHNAEFEYPLTLEWGSDTHVNTNPFWNPVTSFGGELFLPFDFPTSITDDDGLMSNRRLDLYYGRALGENDFGFHFGYVNSSWENDAEDDNEQQDWGMYSFDAGLTMMDGLLDLAAGIDLYNFGWENADGVTLVDPSGQFGFNAMIRYFKSFNPSYSIVPHAGFETGKLGAAYSYDSAGTSVEYATDEYTYTSFDLGVGLQGTPANNVLMVLDCGVMFNKIKGEFTDVTADSTDELSFTKNAIPYFKAGFDADVFKWLDVRFGATTYWAKDTYEDNEGNKYKDRYSNNDTYLGLGFHFNRLHIDAQVDPNLFLDGFNFVSGTTTQMNWRLSTVYEF